MTKNTKNTTNAKTRLLAYLSKDAGNTTLTVAQARSRFKIVNPTARIADLRADGHKIVTTMREGRDGIERAVYSLARPVASSRRTARV
jgi:hypothetical protein